MHRRPLHPRRAPLAAALALLSLAALACAGAGASGTRVEPAASGPRTLALAGATLVDGTGAPPVADAVVLVADGRIACAGARGACPVPAGAEIVDVGGRWITPGLVDAHVHLSQTGWADGRPDALDVRSAYPYPEVAAELARRPERFLRALLCSGVTTAFDLGGFPWTVAVARAAESDPRAPRLAATGPIVSTFDIPLNLPGSPQVLLVGDPDAARQAVATVAELGAAAVKLLLEPVPNLQGAELEAVALAVGEAAAEHGLALVVHATGLAQAKLALAAGARVLVHGVDDRPVDHEFLELGRRAGVVYIPTLTVLGGYVKLYRAGAGEPPEIEDPHRCVDEATFAKASATALAEEAARAEGLSKGMVGLLARRAEPRQRQSGENLLAVSRAGIAIAMGTDAGNPLTLHGPAVYAELEAMAAAGLSPMAVLVAATRGGALAIGRRDELGTVEAGKAADLLVLGADPTLSVRAFRDLRLVMKGGALHPVEELAGR